jgi:anti-sigma regulatory factor (Ser/Thr protein kinase)
VIWPGKPPIALRLSADHARLRIEVWDHSPDDPVPVTAEADALGGRGLLIVESLSNRWGLRRIAQVYKAVWAEMLIPEPQPADPS